MVSDADPMQRLTLALHSWAEVSGGGKREGAETGSELMRTRWRSVSGHDRSAVSGLDVSVLATNRLAKTGRATLYHPAQRTARNRLRADERLL